MSDHAPDIIEQAAQAALNAGRAHLGLKSSQLSELPPPSAELWRIEARAALSDALPGIIQQAKAEAWDEGFAMSELSWRHIYDGHDCAEGEMCPTCCQLNPYRADRIEQGGQP